MVQREEKVFLSVEPVKLTYLRLSFNMMFTIKGDFLSSQFPASLLMLLGVGGTKSQKKERKQNQTKEISHLLTVNRTAPPHLPLSSVGVDSGSC